MHIPVKVDYGVRALIDLAQHEESSPIRSADIARRQFVPEAFLDRLLLTMSKAGLVMSQRGPQGGHALALAPDQISLGAVMESMGETETMVGCLDDPSACNISPACSQCDIWREVEDAVRQVLDNTTIADLVERLADREPVQAA